jgi:hypothetical protein
MTPADGKEWWLAAAAISTIAGPAAKAEAATTPTSPATPAGVVSGVAGPVTGSASNQVLYVGSNTFQGEKLRTGPASTLHILFMDQSSITLGPDSSLTIDTFTYDPQTKTGKIAVNLAQGSARVVGGRISKTTPTVIKTPMSTVELLGGITVVDSTPLATRSSFLFGNSMQMSTPGGTQTQTVTRAGFGVAASNEGLTTPYRVSQDELARNLRAFETTGGQASSGQQPGAAPNGALISTSDIGGSATNTPGNSLAPDRTEANVSNTLDANPPGTLRFSVEGSAAQDTVRNALRDNPANITS